MIFHDILYETKINEEELIYKKTKKLIKQWEEVEKKLNILLRHSLTIDINQRLFYIETCVKNKNKDELLIACYDAHAQLTAVLRSKKPTLSNIF